VGGQMLEGGHIGALVQPTAFLIVVSGTIGAVMLQSPKQTFIKGIKMARWIFFPPSVDAAQLIRQMAEWSNVARREGLLSLETQSAQIKDEFQLKGIQLVVDGADPERLGEGVEGEVE